MENWFGIACQHQGGIGLSTVVTHLLFCGGLLVYVLGEFACGESDWNVCPTAHNYRLCRSASGFRMLPDRSLVPWMMAGWVRVMAP